MNASIKLLEAVLPAVVSLKAEIPESHPSAGVLGTERHGSGVLIESADVVLTVSYVVIGARRLEVTLVDGTTQEGRVVGKDFGSGIALVQVDAPVQRGLRSRRSTRTSGLRAPDWAASCSAWRRPWVSPYSSAASASRNIFRPCGV